MSIEKKKRIVGKRKYYSKCIVGKLRVYNYLNEDNKVGNHLLETTSFSMENLKKMSAKYPIR